MLFSPQSFDNFASPNLIGNFGANNSEQILKRGANLPQNNSQFAPAIFTSNSSTSDEVLINNSNPQLVGSGSAGYFSSNSSTSHTLTPNSGGSPVIQSPDFAPSRSTTVPGSIPSNTSFVNQPYKVLRPNRGQSHKQ